MITESNIKVYETTDYSLFAKLLGNRDAKSEIKIVESIKAVGSIPVPLIVNEKMEIIDGQNRLAAFRQLGLPVYFIKIDGLDINACRRLNTGQTNWGIDDYIESYAEQGNTNYQRLSSLLNEFRKPFGIDGVISMSKPSSINDGGAAPNKSLKSGRFQLSIEEYELGTIRLRSAIELGYADFYKRKRFSSKVYWACVSYIYQHQDVSAKEVIDKLLQYEAVIPCCNRVSEQLQFFDDAINRGTRRPTDKVFLSSDFQKRKYIEVV